MLLFSVSWYLVFLSSTIMDVLFSVSLSFFGVIPQLSYQTSHRQPTLDTATKLNFLKYKFYHVISTEKFSGLPHCFCVRISMVPPFLVVYTIAFPECRSHRKPLAQAVSKTAKFLPLFGFIYSHNSLYQSDSYSSLSALFKCHLLH